MKLNKGIAYILKQVREHNEFGTEFPTINYQRLYTDRIIQLVHDFLDIEVHSVLRELYTGDDQTDTNDALKIAENIIKTIKKNMVIEDRETYHPWTPWKDI